MFLPTVTTMPFGKAAAPPISLKFVERPVDLTQRRFANRTVLVPDLDLEQFKFRAVIDWVKFRVMFTRPTQFRWVQEVAKEFLRRNSHIEPVCPGPGNVSTTFDIRIQEPESLAWVHSMYAGLVRQFGEGTTPLFGGIEISVDAYPKDGSQQSRHLLLAAMQRSLWTKRNIMEDSDSRPRSVIGRTSSDVVKLLPLAPISAVNGVWRPTPANYHTPWVDGTMYLGARNDDVMIRLMDKIIDRQNRPIGEVLELSNAQKRVRIEVKIEGYELINSGIFEFSDARAFKFTSLQGDFFQFRLPTFRATSPKALTAQMLAGRPLDQIRAEVFMKAGVLGVEHYDAVTDAYRKEMHEPALRQHLKALGRKVEQPRVGQGQQGTLVAYHEMNDAVARALVNLSNREDRAWKLRDELGGGGW